MRACIDAYMHACPWALELKRLARTNVLKAGRHGSPRFKGVSGLLTPRCLQIHESDKGDEGDEGGECDKDSQEGLTRQHTKAPRRATRRDSGAIQQHTLQRA